MLITRSNVLARICRIQSALEATGTFASEDLIHVERPPSLYSSNGNVFLSSDQKCEVWVSNIIGTIDSLISLSLSFFPFLSLFGYVFFFISLIRLDVDDDYGTSC